MTKRWHNYSLQISKESSWQTCFILALIFAKRCGLWLFQARMQLNITRDFLITSGTSTFRLLYRWKLESPMSQSMNQQIFAKPACCSFYSSWHFTPSMDHEPPASESAGAHVQNVKSYPHSCCIWLSGLMSRSCILISCPS